MQEIGDAVKQGARAYLRKQFSVVAVFFGFFFLFFLWLSSRGYISIFVPFAFLSGGFLSALSGYIGMSIATSSGDRTAQMACSGLNSALRTAFSAGAVMSFTVVGLGILHVAGWYYFLDRYFSINPVTAGDDKTALITFILLCSAFGASFQALFARVGGGIFTKSADVGADLVGKIEAGIPEDDPRNAAVIADNVGDCVGDCAGMGADLYESYIGSIVAAMALATATGIGPAAIAAPMAIAGFGILACIIGMFFIRTKEKAGQEYLLRALRRGIFVSVILIAVFSYFIIRRLLGAAHTGIYFSVLSGLFCGVFLGISTEYFTSYKYGPTRWISASALTGPATVIISGLAVGMVSIALPVIIVALVIIASFFLSGGAGNINIGLYGIGMSAVGMLSTLGIVLASDAYGPVADNAGGNAEMSHLPTQVRQRTDALDALGNTTAAVGKGFAIGSAALTALVLIAAYRNNILLLGQNIDMEFMNPRLISGLFIGGMIPFLFCSLTLGSVGRAALKVVEEVRRQFKQIPGLMEGKAKADYARCVNIVTAAAQKEMILPSLLAVITPVLVGLFIGLEAVVGLLVGALVSGFSLALFMANSGCAWDNAKKYIEAGNYGGKGSDAHKASVVGDTLGDPFKDTSGPSLNILIKLMSMISIILASFIAKNMFFK